MAESKKIVVNLPESLINEFDEILKIDCKNRSEFIREAIIVYIEEKKKYRIREMMRMGYMEMGKLNSEIAEYGCEADFHELCEYEARLAECDSIDDDNGEKRRNILC